MSEGTRIRPLDRAKKLLVAPSKKKRDAIKPEGVWLVDKCFFRNCREAKNGRNCRSWAPRPDTADVAHGVSSIGAGVTVALSVNRKHGRIAPL